MILYVVNSRQVPHVDRRKARAMNRDKLASGVPQRLTDAEWAHIEPLRPAVSKPGGANSDFAIREVRRDVHSEHRLSQFARCPRKATQKHRA